jgi:hypothetical protein
VIVVNLVWQVANDPFMRFLEQEMEERKRLIREAEKAREAEEELCLKEAEERRIRLKQEEARKWREQAERERKESRRAPPTRISTAARGGRATKAN